MTNEKRNEEVTFEITEHIGIIAVYSNRWTKELNKISWNGSKPKFDIRDWDDRHEKMSRGVTLREEEMFAMYEFLKILFAKQDDETEKREETISQLQAG